MADYCPAPEQKIFIALKPGRLMMSVIIYLSFAGVDSGVHIETPFGVADSMSSHVISVRMECVVKNKTKTRHKC
jgi:hypothetical protein